MIAMRIDFIRPLQLDLANEVKKGCADEDLVGLIFNTIGVRYYMYFKLSLNIVDTELRFHSDAITMGTDGKK